MTGVESSLESVSVDLRMLTSIHKTATIKVAIQSRRRVSLELTDCAEGSKLCEPEMFPWSQDSDAEFWSVAERPWICRDLTAFGPLRNHGPQELPRGLAY